MRASDLLLRVDRSDDSVGPVLTSGSRGFLDFSGAWPSGVTGQQLIREPHRPVRRCPTESFAPSDRPKNATPLSDECFVRSTGSPTRLLDRQTTRYHDLPPVAGWLFSNMICASFKQKFLTMGKSVLPNRHSFFLLGMGRSRKGLVRIEVRHRSSFFHPDDPALTAWWRCSGILPTAL